MRVDRFLADGPYPADAELMRARKYLEGAGPLGSEHQLKP
jgi:hypothetical protein